MAPSSDVNHLSHPCIYGDFVSSHPERKFGFMKWLSRLFKGGSNRTNEPAEENMSWRAPSRALDDRGRAQKEKEDLGHAMSLSSAEDLKRPNGRQGYRWGADTDEDYGNTLNSSARPPYAPAPFYPNEYRRICGGCNQEIINGNCLGCMDTYFHPDCFRCHSCRYPITEREIPINATGLMDTDATLFGLNSIVHPMNMIIQLTAVVVKDWSLGI